MLAISPLSRLHADRRITGEHEVEWTITIPSIDMEIDVVVEFDFRAGHPGQTFGRPENCFPPEADECEIVRVVGLHSGVCCMKMLAREVEIVRPYYGVGPRTQTLLDRLRDEMIEHIRD